MKPLIYFSQLAHNAKCKEKLQPSLHLAIKAELCGTNFLPPPYCQQVEFIEELPKTVSGKVKRNELRKKEWKTI